MRRRLGSFTTSVVVGLLVAFLLPLACGWVYILGIERRTEVSKLESLHVRLMDGLSESMTDALEAFEPQHAAGIALQTMQLEEVTAVRVSSAIFGMDLVAIEDPQRRSGVLTERTQAVYGREGEELGTVSVTVNTGPMEARLKERRDWLLITFLLMYLSGLSIILPVVWIKALFPVRRLLRQAKLISLRRLDQPFRWSGYDEFSVLGQSFEAMRVSLRNRFKEIEDKAATDDLTGLANRRSFREAAEKGVRLAHRHRQPLSLILVDVDHFKKINDMYGHPAGDIVLQDVAAHLAEIIRSSDFVGRWGGEEFTVLLPNTESVGAEVLAEKIRSSTEDRTFAMVGKLTVSMGVATLRPNDSFEALLSRTDKALYTAKQGGRNRFEVEQ